ncbi:phosphoribosyl-AMP cyclohydrolase [Rhizobium sp. PAMB 3182]
MPMTFAPPSKDKADWEIVTDFTPRFDANGLITAVVTDAADGMLLMVAHMNAESLALTIETGVAHYYSRSRNSLWKKGETSGNLQQVREILTDCDQDAIWLKVSVSGHDATCHTGRRTCFYRSVEQSEGGAHLVFSEEKPRFDPKDVYDA